MVSLTNFKRVRDHDELAPGSYDNPAFSGHQVDQDSEDSQSVQAAAAAAAAGTSSDYRRQPSRQSNVSARAPPLPSTPIRILVECPPREGQQQSNQSAADHQSPTTDSRNKQQQVSPVSSSSSSSSSSEGALSSQRQSVGGSSGDSGVIEHQQSAISFYSSNSSTTSSQHTPGDENVDDQVEHHHHHHHHQHCSPSTSSSASSLTRQRRLSSSGAALEGVTDDDCGSFVGQPILTLDELRNSIKSPINQQQQQDQTSEITINNTRHNATPNEQRNLKMVVPQIVPLSSALLSEKRRPLTAPLSFNTEQQQHQQHSVNKQSAGATAHCEDELLVDGRHFEIRWNDLYYQVEPKWYQQRWRSLFSPQTSLPQTTLTDNSSMVAPSSVGIIDNGHHQAPPIKRLPVASVAKTHANKTVSILNNLNGSVRSGQVTAILGPSGAGKTSLLGCLTGKNRTGVSGTIQVKGGPDKPLSICTIPQKDYLLNQLTVRENLWFASRLKHPEDNFDHDSNINRVLALLKLESCVDTKISKISGGQYKRVSIAQELLSNPDILILDEPTSGLDSLTCYKTVMVLRDLAQLSPNPMAIIVTIHQPQREVFDLFNHVYILAVGGQAIYEGRPSQSIETINKCSAGTSLHFDASSYNPASYLVEIASAEFGLKPIEALAEHQLREFKKRTQEQDYRQHQLLLLMHQQQQQQQQSTPSMGYTPGGHRKRESPIVARFKSTFGLGSLNLQQQQQQQQPFDSPMSLHLGLPTIHEPRPSPAMSRLQVNRFRDSQLDAGSQAMSTFGGSRLELTSNSLDIGARTNNTMSASSAASLAASSQQNLASGEFFLDQRLQTHKHNHDGHFFRHCKLLTKRSWLCLCKDPMLTTLRFAAHIFVPLLITLVYGNRVGKPNACPLYESDMDLIDYARRGATRLLGLQDELRCTFENVGLYFLSIYAFTFSTMCLTSLSFPLNMHVLLKEVRNGWYSIPTFFIGKTLADFPLEFILPTVTLMITYPLTGQPSSYMEWRFLVGTAIFVLTSLIAQTQGLIFGALFMNAMQAAVFVAPVSTTPLILLSGFLIRIGQMPRYLQILSSFSYFRYAIEGLTIIRYGFGMCPCDPEVVTGQPVTASGVPEQLRTMTNYWLSTFNVPGDSDATTVDYSLEAGGLSNSTTTMAAAATASIIANATDGAGETDFFQDLTVLLARANSFGANITTCDDLKPYPMIDFNLKDEQLYIWMAGLVGTLLVSKIINYLVVKYSVKFRL